MRAKRAKICHFYVKFDTNVEKRGSLGVDWIIKRGSLGVGSAQKGGLLTGTWYPPTYGSAPPPGLRALWRRRSLSRLDLVTVNFLWGYCTPKLKWACSVCYLKIIKTFSKTNNSRTACPTSILSGHFLVPWTIYYKMHILFFKRCWQFWDRGPDMLFLVRMQHPINRGTLVYHGNLNQVVEVPLHPKVGGDFWTTLWDKIFKLVEIVVVASPEWGNVFSFIWFGYFTPWTWVLSFFMLCFLFLFLFLNTPFKKSTL